MSDEEMLRKQAREAIQAGRFPGYRPNRIWGGSGSGETCTICGKAVGFDEIEFEIEFARDDGRQCTHHVHSRCFAAWEIEQRNLAATPATGESCTPPGSTSNADRRMT